MRHLVFYVSRRRWYVNRTNKCEIKLFFCTNLKFASRNLNRNYRNIYWNTKWGNLFTFKTDMRWWSLSELLPYNFFSYDAQILNTKSTK